MYGYIRDWGTVLPPVLGTGTKGGTKMQRDGAAKHWVWTLNNFTEEERIKVKELHENRDECVYGVYGREVGDGGTPHLQGYTVFARRVRLNQVKSYLGSRIHAEVARGTATQASDYCKKGGDFDESGEVPRTAGKRKTRDELAVEFVESVRSRDVERFRTENPGTWAWDGEKLMRNYVAGVEPVVRSNIAVTWYWGDPGVGKSRLAHEKLPDAYIKEPRTKWWNGYMLQKEVIIDDFGPNGIDINHLLRWFDRYKCLVEYKGGMCALHAETFIVTSNFSPQQVYTDEKTGQ